MNIIKKIITTIILFIMVLPFITNAKSVSDIAIGALAIIGIIFYIVSKKKKMNSI